MSKLLFQGHGSYRIITDENVVIYVDPYIGDGYDIEADIILVTHEHYDHNKIELVKQKSDCVVIRYNTLKVGHIYNKTSIKGVEIEAVEAYNAKHDKNACVGFVLRFDNLSVYCSGDTSKTDDMENKLSKYGLDYALLPIDGIYNMDALEASLCAEIIGAKHTIPIHMKPLELFDMESALKFNHSSRLIVEAGKEINL
ncbi:MAG: MBL fold metallo-hydrolase [Bacilli bacterium]|nr:MBL fold metallo-hydrolase [Bacilli bacterium]